MELIPLCARRSWHSSDNIVEETSISCLDICQKCGEEGIEEMGLQMESSDERYKSPKIRIAVETTRIPANRYCFGTFSPHGGTIH
ncbi:hypothetical protein ALC57_08634 [Trachymyrmex cornetzi]|uniref:Uncharacterized protein n=1 Tax=Trachymyrmex cornetzi TaxID=471704 RepID=A0A195E1I5_9HYME|nr:hypothetical protein ALC57_08634 [Trachymyrmex cornetzi]